MRFYEAFGMCLVMYLIEIWFSSHPYDPADDGLFGGWMENWWIGSHGKPSGTMSSILAEEPRSRPNSMGVPKSTKTDDLEGQAVNILRDVNRLKNGLFVVFLHFLAKVCKSSKNPP